jgi:hypothetical protein
MPTEKYGVRSPFHAGGGGGGGGGSGAATQVFEGTSYTVPTPHSTALALPGDASVRVAKRRENRRDDDCQMNNFAPHFEASFVPRPRLSHILRRVGNRFNRIDHHVRLVAGV